LNSEYDEEIFFDYAKTDDLEQMHIEDPRIIDVHLNHLKINPYEILLKIKNKERDYNIIEANLLVNAFANIDPEKSQNKCIIKSDFLGVRSEGIAKTKKLSRLYAAQNFLGKIYPDYKWGRLEEIFLTI